MTNSISNATQRLLALDVFRGLTIFLMFTVNTPGNWAFIYPTLGHAKWQGWTPTDFVFPFFLFTVGVSAWFSFKKFEGKPPSDLYYKIIKRGTLIFLIGLGLNMFLNSLSSYENLRIMGVLQRIGLAYIFGALICVSFSRQVIAVIGAALLLGYWAMQYYMSDPTFPFAFHDGTKYFGVENNIVTRFDNWLLGANHLYKGYDRIPFDPEGLLSTIPAIGTVILGYFTGILIDGKPDRRELVKVMLMFGIGALALGVLWGSAFPINKPIWSSSYVLLMAGWCLVINAALIWIIDVKPTTEEWGRMMLGLAALSAAFWSLAIFYPNNPVFNFESFRDATVGLTVLLFVFGLLQNAGIDSWKRFFIVLGMNSLLAFVVSGAYTKIAARIKLDSSYETTTLAYENNAVVPKKIGLMQKMYEDVFTPITTPRALMSDYKSKKLTAETRPAAYEEFAQRQKLSSLISALFHALLFWAILWVFYKFNIFLKV